MASSASVPEFDPALIARYDLDGPGYAGYPTLPRFRVEFNEVALRAAIRASNEEPIPRSLALCVQVPVSADACIYCGSNRPVIEDRASAGRYLERLYREIELMAPLFDRDRPVRQLLFGGGAQKFFGSVNMRELAESLARHFSFSHDPSREYAIEVDPCCTTAADVSALGALGFNQLSVSVQDFDASVQSAIARVHEVARTRALLEAARTAQFRVTTIDLSYGLPAQTLAGFAQTLDQVIALNPDRVAVYGYAHMPQVYAAQQQVDAADVPASHARAALFGCALERLCAAGYCYLGMDHFARADDALAQAQAAGTLQRGFRGFSTQGDCDIVGLGVGAITRIGDSYSQGAQDLLGYSTALDDGHLPITCGLHLDDDGVTRRELVGTLMCHGVLDKVAFGERHRLHFDEYFARERQRLQPLLADGLVREDSATLRVTSQGRLLLRIIAMCFDANLDDEAQSPLP
ncbi:MAG: oxygen-independent coproporphyrinogen III oxidase [Rhodanobacter sp.]